MPNNKITPSNPTGMVPPDNDIKNMQARRRGLYVVGDENCQTRFVAFPPRSQESTDDLESSLYEVCDSDSATAEADRFSVEPDDNPARTGRTARHTPLGVLMPTLSLTRPISGRNNNDIGVLTHAIVQMLAPHVRDIPTVLIPEKVLDIASALVDIPRVSERRSLITTASGHACVYLRRLFPIDWDLLGCEFNLPDGGRVDLAFQQPDNGLVFFDEIKTTKKAPTRPSRHHLDQCERYRAAGVEMFGDQFAGVRLVYLGALNASRLITPDGDPSSIAPITQTPFGDTTGASA